MDTFRLPLFPEGSLAASVVTTVWVGVWVVCFFNLRLGWTFSGLVVPGYLVPLFIAKPWAGVIICLEGIAAYLLVWFLSEPLSRTGLWCGIFGRDRFFALILGSIVMRLIGDCWLLPMVGAWVNARYGIEFDYHNNLHSYGLIVVALIANQFWKPGVRRGLLPFSIILGITFLLVRFVLMEFTNFTIGNLQYMYEDMAASLLASPKAYIVLVTTAFLASRMNLIYSWESNGILVPALLALQWYEPIKILTSVIEAVAIYCLALLVLQAPYMRARSFEGAWKLFLFFTLAFAYKMLLGFVLPRFWPNIRVSDCYGFGYLLPTLLAIKAHDKGIAFRITSTTFQISIIGGVAGSLIGFLLTLCTTAWQEAYQPDRGPAPPVDTLEYERLGDVLLAEKVALYEQRIPGSMPIPLLRERTAFRNGLHELLAYVENRQQHQLDRARAELHRCNYRLRLVENRFLCLCEQEPRRGWGTYVFSLDGPAAGPVIEVPAPLDEWATLEVGVTLFRELPGRALALAGSGRSTNWDASSDVLRNPRSLFQTFHQTVALTSALQVRGPGRDAMASESGLWVQTALPPGLSLAALRQLVGTYAVHWEPTPGQNAQAAVSPGQFAELYLTRAARRNLLARSAVSSPKPQVKAGIERLRGSLQPWLFAGRERTAMGGTNLFRRADQVDLLLFDEEILTPLQSVAYRSSTSPPFSGEEKKRLDEIAQSAAIFGYRLIWYTDPSGPADFLVLAEPDQLPRRHWGTYVYRVGTASSHVIQVPRPIFERNAYEYGVMLFERLGARALFLHGAHPEANLDRSSDVLHPRKQVNLFSLASQVILRETRDEPLMIVQARTFGVRAHGVVSQADMLLATTNGATGPEALTPLGKDLYRLLEADQMRVDFVNGSPETTGYEANSAPQAGYLVQAWNKELALVWLSPSIRSLYRQQVENRILNAQFQAVGIPTVEGDLYEQLARCNLRSGEWRVTGPESRPVAANGTLDAQLRKDVDRYIARQDIVLLHQLRTAHPRVRFARVMDVRSQQAFLLMITDTCRLPIIANLSPKDRNKPSITTATTLTAAEVRRFIDARTTWLELSEQP
jgi:hypothetical protein